MDDLSKIRNLSDEEREGVYRTVRGQYVTGALTKHVGSRRRDTARGTPSRVIGLQNQVKNTSRRSARQQADASGYGGFDVAAR